MGRPSISKSCNRNNARSRLSWVDCQKHSLSCGNCDPADQQRSANRNEIYVTSSTASGDGEIFFGPSQTSQNVQDQKEIVLIIRNNSDHNVKEFFPQGISIPDPPNFRTEVDHVLLKCNENKFLIDKTEFWSAAKELVRVVALNRELPFNFSEFKEFTPYATIASDCLREKLWRHWRSGHA